MIPERLRKFVREWRTRGINISDDEADGIYRYCIRKMEAAKARNPDEYIDLIYPDEIKNYLLRLSVNAATMQRRIKKEVDEDVFNLLTESMSSTVP